MIKNGNQIASDDRSIRAEPLQCHPPPAVASRVAALNPAAAAPKFQVMLMKALDIAVPRRMSLSPDAMPVIVFLRDTGTGQQHQHDSSNR